MASTFEFDAAFFEADLLPRFLGLRFDHTENEPTFLIEREEKLAAASAAVLVDVHRVDPAQTTLRWDQVPIAVPGPRSVQHSKVVLLAWERLVRLIVGSANIKRTGYRRNREVFAALDFWDDGESVPLAPLRDAVDHLERLLNWARVPDATRKRIRETLAGIRDRVKGWTNAPDDFRPRQLPRVKFVATFPRIEKVPARSALDLALETWGNRRATDVTVFTPFVGEPVEGGDAVIDRLAAVPRVRDCTTWLVVPRSPAEDSDSTIRVPLPKTFGDAWQQSFGAHGRVGVLAIPQCVENSDPGNRPFHSKLLSLEDEDRHLLMIGSSNFTPHGMGIGVFNVEANLLFEDAQDGMCDRIELPLGWDDAQPVKAIQWLVDSELDKDTAAEGEVTPPGFFACASYSPTTGVLRVALDRTAEEPRAWVISLGAGGDTPLLFRGPAQPGQDTLSHAFLGAGKPANPAALTVSWADDAGTEYRARLLISVESIDDLIPPEAIRSLGIDAVFDCLTRGLSLAEWHARRPPATADRTSINSALDSHRSVDTSQYVLYRTRQFGRALHGLCERLDRTPLTPAAVNYRLFKDPLGPIPFAETLATAATAADGLTPATTGEHRLFLVAELLLAVAHVTREMVRSADFPTKKWLRPAVARAIGELTSRLNACRGELAGAVPKNLSEYIGDVLDRLGELHGPSLAGVTDAG